MNMNDTQLFDQRRCMILQKVEQIRKHAQERYGFSIQINVRFDLRGMAAGQAYRINGEYGIRFNRDMMVSSGWDHLYNDTVPHEIAHLVCFFNPVFGSGHNAGWKDVCITLGGSGQRCHNEEVSYARAVKRFLYKHKNGQKAIVSHIVHNRIQEGQRRRFASSGAIIDHTCEYELYSIGGKVVASV